MSQIRILEPGWETFSDFLGEVEFKDGVSINPVTRFQAQRIGGNIKIEMLDGSDPSEAAEHAELVNSEVPLTVFDAPVIAEEAQPIVYDFTRESLEDTADKKGLAGLRPIGEKYGVKSNSIIGLIDNLMALTGEEKL